MVKDISLGEHLRSARKEKGWNIPFVSKELCISKDYLRALENDDRENLPQTIFAIGFLRSYAKHLGLDANGLVQSAQVLYKQTVAPVEVSIPEAPKESRIPAKSLMLTIVASLVGIYGTWMMFSDGGALRAELTPFVPKHLSKLIAEEYSDPTGLSTDMQILSDDIVEPSVNKPDDDSILTPSELPETMNFNFTEKTDRVANQNISKAASKNISGENKNFSPLEIKAEKDTWVLIRTAKNETLMEGVLKSGDSFSSPEGEELFLTTGDAGAIKIVVNGQISDPLGKNGIVLKDVDLSKYSKVSNSASSSH